MIGIHCYNCGGFIGDPSQSHRLAASMKHKTFGAVTTSARCTCTPSVVYEPWRGRSSAATQPGLNAVATAALADAVTRGVVSSPVEAHIRNRLGLV